MSSRAKLANAMLAGNKIYNYRVQSFLRHANLKSVKQVRQRDVDWFIESPKLSAHTKKAYIKAVEAVSGKRFRYRIRLPQKRPIMISLHDLSRAYKHANRTGNDWLCWFLKLCYFTGLRHRDICERLIWHDDMIEAEAKKTGKLHLIPRHIVMSGTPPKMYRNPKSVYYQINKLCDETGLDHFTPQMIRKTAANEYEKAHSGAGAILLGHALGDVTHRYYLDSVEVLRVAQLSLRIPDAMLPADQVKRQKLEDKQVMQAFRRLPPDERQAILKIITKAG